MDKEIMKGSTDILLLSVLVKEDSYGYEIISKLKENSQNLYEMSEGTLYPALQRLQKKGWITSYWGESDTGGRRKYYQITEEGKKVFTQKLNDWREVNNIVSVCTGGITWIRKWNLT